MLRTLNKPLQQHTDQLQRYREFRLMRNLGGSTSLASPLA